MDNDLKFQIMHHSELLLLLKSIALAERVSISKNVKSKRAFLKPIFHKKTKNSNLAFEEVE